MKPESERLLYEPITRQHALELQQALCDPRVYAFIDECCPPTHDELLQSFARKQAGAPAQRAGEVWIDYAVRSRQTGIAMGRVEATILDHKAEVAYLFGASFWGCGYALEAVQWLQQWVAWSYGINDCWATVSAQNARSIRLLGRLGYVESAQAEWPARLLSYGAGDRVFHRSS